MFTSDKALNELINSYKLFLKEHHKIQDSEMAFIFHFESYSNDDKLALMQGLKQHRHLGKWIVFDGKKYTFDFNMQLTLESGNLPKHEGEEVSLTFTDLITAQSVKLNILNSQNQHYIILPNQKVLLTLFKVFNFAQGDVVLRTSYLNHGAVNQNINFYNEVDDQIIHHVHGDHDKGYYINEAKLHYLSHYYYGQISHKYECLSNIYNIYYKAKNISFQDAVRSGNVDSVIQEKMEDILNLSLGEMLNITKSHNIRYTTLLHYLVQHLPLHDADQLLLMFKRNSDKAFYKAYINATDSNGTTIYQVAVERGLMAPKAKLDLRVDSHETIVNNFVEESINKLYQSFCQKVVNESPATLHVYACQFLLMLEDQKYINSLEFQAKIGLLFPELNEQQVLSKIQLIKYKIKTVFNMLNNLINDGHYGHLYMVEAETIYRNTNLTILQIIGLCCWAICDFSNLTCKLALAELRLIDGLYDAKRGYNIDEGLDDPGDVDKNRCEIGTINAIINSLNGIHNLVQVYQPARLDCILHGKVMDFFAKYQPLGNEMWSALLFKWQSDKMIPYPIYELLRDKSSSIMKEVMDENPMLLKVLLKHPRVEDADSNRRDANLNNLLKLLYRAYITNLEIPRLFSSEYMNFDIAEYVLSFRSNRNELLECFYSLPYLIRCDEKGYVSALFYIYQLDKLLYKSLLEAAVHAIDSSPNIFLSLIDNRFYIGLSMLRLDEARLLFVEHFIEKYKGNTQIMLKNDHDKKNIVTALIILKDYISLDALLDSLSCSQFDKKHLIDFACCAVRYDNSVALQAFLSMGLSSNTIVREGYTLLMYAKNRDTAEVLIKNNSDVNKKSLNGSTALMFAVVQAENCVVEMLCRAGAEVNCIDENGYSATFFAVEANKLRALEILLSYRASPNMVFNNMSLLMHATMHRYYDIMKLLLRNGANPAFELLSVNDSKRVNFGNTALRVAAFNGDLFACELIASFYKNKEKLKSHGSVALVAASRYGYLNVIKYLVEVIQVSLHSVDEELGLNVLMAAVISLKVDVVKYLIKAGVDVYDFEFDKVILNFNDDDFEVYNNILELLNSVDVAVSDMIESIRFSISAKERIIVIYPDYINTGLCGSNLFLEACKAHNSSFVQSMIVLGGNVNYINQDGNTPLMIASYYGNLNVVQLLIESGADANAKNARQYTALDMAMQTNQRAVCEILKPITICRKSSFHKLCSGMQNFLS